MRGLFIRMKILCSEIIEGKVGAIGILESPFLVNLYGHKLQNRELRKHRSDYYYVHSWY